MAEAHRDQSTGYSVEVYCEHKRVGTVSLPDADPPVHEITDAAERFAAPYLQRVPGRGVDVEVVSKGRVHFKLRDKHEALSQGGMKGYVHLMIKLRLSASPTARLETRRMMNELWWTMTSVQYERVKKLGKALDAALYTFAPDLLKGGEDDSSGLEEVEQDVQDVQDVQAVKEGGDREERSRAFELDWATRVARGEDVSAGSFYEVSMGTLVAQFNLLHHWINNKGSWVPGQRLNYARVKAALYHRVYRGEKFEHEAPVKRPEWLFSRRVKQTAPKLKGEGLVGGYVIPDLHPEPPA